jgi:hypothetical protein
MSPVEEVKRAAGKSGFGKAALEISSPDMGCPLAASRLIRLPGKQLPDKRIRGAISSTV